VKGWDKLVEPYLQLLQIPVSATFGLLAVFVCLGIGYDFGKRLKQEAIVSAAMATLIFLMIQLKPEDERPVHGHSRCSDGRAGAKVFH